MLLPRTLRPRREHATARVQMAKGQVKQGTNNKPKLSTKEKQKKKAEKKGKK